MLWWRHLPKTEAMGKTEGRKEAHEGSGESGNSPGSLHGGSEDLRGRVDHDRKSTALALLVLTVIVPALALYKGLQENDVRFL